MTEMDRDSEVRDTDRGWFLWGVLFMPMTTFEITENACGCKFRTSSQEPTQILCYFNCEPLLLVFSILEHRGPMLSARCAEITR